MADAGEPGGYCDQVLVGSGCGSGSDVGGTEKGTGGMKDLYSAKANWTSCNLKKPIF